MERSLLTAHLTFRACRVQHAPRDQLHQPTASPTLALYQSLGKGMTQAGADQTQFDDRSQ